MLQKANTQVSALYCYQRKLFLISRRFNEFLFLNIMLIFFFRSSKKNNFLKKKKKKENVSSECPVMNICLFCRKKELNAWILPWRFRSSCKNIKKRKLNILFHLDLSFMIMSILDVRNGRSSGISRILPISKDKGRSTFFKRHSYSYVYVNTWL